jgi:hypothetical protein
MRLIEHNNSYVGRKVLLLWTEVLCMVVLKTVMCELATAVEQMIAYLPKRQHRPQGPAAELQMPSSCSNGPVTGGCWAKGALAVSTDQARESSLVSMFLETIRQWYGESTITRLFGEMLLWARDCSTDQSGCMQLNVLSYAQHFESNTFQVGILEYKRLHLLTLLVWCRRSEVSKAT